MVADHQPSRTMPVKIPTLSQKKKWNEELRESTAQHELQRGRPDQVPLSRLHAATNALITNKKVSQQTEKCDTLLRSYLRGLKGQLWTEHVGIIMCVPAFTYGAARDMILSVKPDPDTAPEEPLFHYKVSAYLQTIMLSKTTNSSLIPATLFFATKELFGVMQGTRERFVSVTRLLRALRHPNCEEFLPVRIVKMMLEQFGYRERLHVKLEELSQAQEWSEVYRLVGDLESFDCLGRQDVLETLQDAIPDHLKWKSWHPDKGHLDRWGALVCTRQRKELSRFLSLDGPDVSSQGLPTSFQSPEAIGMLGLHFPSEQPDFLDQLLKELDHAVAIGNHAVDLFIHICVHRGPPNTRSLEQLRVVFEMGFIDAQKKNSIARRILNLLRVLLANTNSPSDLIESFTAALPLFDDSPTLQGAFGISIDLPYRAGSALTSVQKHFCETLQRGLPIERFGLQVRAFAQLIRDAHWMSGHWTPTYLAFLQGVPSESELKHTIRAFEKATGDAKQWYRDDLATRLGFSPRRGVDPTTLGASPPEFEDVIWDEKLDIDREILRRQVLLPVKTLDLGLATACLKQSLLEHDIFVRELNGIIHGSNDQICVNLASFLGPRVAKGHSVHDAWSNLLLNLMWQRPTGLLDRCALTLMPKSFSSWIQNLRLLYQDEFLEPEGRLGFTNEKINYWMVRSRGVGRSVSTSTYATTSTSATGTSRISEVSALTTV
jgi:hypothetical protein